MNHKNIRETLMKEIIASDVSEELQRMEKPLLVDEMQNVDSEKFTIGNHVDQSKTKMICVAKCPELDDENLPHCTDTLDVINEKEAERDYCPCGNRTIWRPLEEQSYKVNDEAVIKGMKNLALENPEGFTILRQALLERNDSPKMRAILDSIAEEALSLRMLITSKNDEKLTKEIFSVGIAGQGISMRDRATAVNSIIQGTHSNADKSERKHIKIANFAMMDHNPNVKQDQMIAAYMNKQQGGDSLKEMAKQMYGDSLELSNLFQEESKED